MAWAGTLASAYDEWIELHNPGPERIHLEGWRLISQDGGLQVTLGGVLGPYGFFLLERTDDTTVADIAADQIYTGSLSNGGETLLLLDPVGNRIDSANAGGGGWPAGYSSSRASMERRGGDDRPGNWATFPGTGGNGHDAGGNPILGTPRQPNAIWYPTPAPTTAVAATPSATGTFTPSPSASPTPSSTPTPPSAQPSPRPTAVRPRSVLINEVAWAGTLASANDEWIELHNPGPEPLPLQGWTLSDGDDLHILLTGTIPARGFFLLERTDDHTIADLPADLIYHGSLRNSGECLELRDARGALVDTANADGGGWPAGDPVSRASMERRGGEDRGGNWATFNEYRGRGHDTAGNSIPGTPGGPNSIHFPTPVPTWFPGKVVINEVLIRPHYDWEGKGGVTTGDEFIELYNIGPRAVDLSGWALDDVEAGGSSPYELPPRVLRPGSYAVFFRSRTRIALNDTGDTVRLLAPDGRVVDQIQYLRVRAYNLSFGRLPDGSGGLYYGLWPTPYAPNRLFVETLPKPPLLSGATCQERPPYGLRLPRIARLPSLFPRWRCSGWLFCPKPPLPPQAREPTSQAGPVSTGGWHQR